MDLVKRVGLRLLHLEHLDDADARDALLHAGGEDGHLLLAPPGGSPQLPGEPREGVGDEGDGHEGEEGETPVLHEGADQEGDEGQDGGQELGELLAHRGLDPLHVGDEPRDEHARGVVREEIVALGHDPLVEGVPQVRDGAQAHAVHGVLPEVAEEPPEEDDEDEGDGDVEEELFAVRGEDEVQVEAVHVVLELFEARVLGGVEEAVENEAHHVQLEGVKGAHDGQGNGPRHEAPLVMPREIPPYPRQGGEAHGGSFRCLSRLHDHLGSKKGGPPGIGPRFDQDYR